jgi:hypothetical protein
MQGDVIKDVAVAGEYLDHLHRKALEKVLMDGGTVADATLPLYIWADRETPVRTIAALVTAAALEPKKSSKAKGKTKLPARAPTDDDPPPPEEEEGGEDRNAAREQAIKQARDAGLIGNSATPRPPAFVVRLIVTSADNAAPLDGAVGAKLPASEPEATERLVGQLKTSIGTCAAIITALGTSGLAGTPDKEAAALIAELPAGLTSCHCKVGNVDELTAAVRVWFGAWAPALQWIEMPKLKATDKQPIRKLVK